MHKLHEGRRLVLMLRGGRECGGAVRDLHDRSRLREASSSTTNTTPVTAPSPESHTSDHVSFDPLIRITLLAKL